MMMAQIADAFDTMARSLSVPLKAGCIEGRAIVSKAAGNGFPTSPVDVPTSFPEAA